MPRKVRVLILGSSGQLGSILNAGLKKQKKLKILNDSLKKKITNKNIKNNKKNKQKKLGGWSELSPNLCKTTLN